MLLRVVDYFFHEKVGKSVVLVSGIYCKIDYMKAVCLVELVCPAGIQVVFALDKIPESLQAGIFFDQPSVSGKQRLGFGETILQNVVRLTFI